MPAIGTMFKNLGTSIIGAADKALLILHGDDSTGAMSTSTVANMASQALKAGSMKDLDALGAQHVLTVQYNPSSLSISASAVSTRMNYLQNGERSDLPNQLQDAPAVTMSVELVFDAVNIKDAFMFEKVSLSANGLVTSGAGIVKNLKDDGYTVQPQTNGLVAMLMRDKTRHITFRWADMAFTGVATQAQARYTMFSVSGKPIRSVIRLRLNQQMDHNTDIQYWDDAFQECFGDAGEDLERGGKNLIDKGSNLVNLRW